MYYEKSRSSNYKKFEKNWLKNSLLLGNSDFIFKIIFDNEIFFIFHYKPMNIEISHCQVLLIYLLSLDNKWYQNSNLWKNVSGREMHIDPDVQHPVQDSWEFCFWFLQGQDFPHKLLLIQLQFSLRVWNYFTHTYFCRLVLLLTSLYAEGLIVCYDGFFIMSWIICTCFIEVNGIKLNW